MSKNIGFISLGCDKNTVDTEKILFQLSSAGYKIVMQPEEADYIIINTCGFIESAKVESINTIMEMAKYKEHCCKKIIVIGCLVNRYYNELKDNLYEADILIKTSDYDNFLDIIECDNEIIHNNFNERNRVLSTPYHYAYLKVSEGCNNKCSYCTIPSIRGHYKSDSIENLVDESKRLIDTYGIRELILVAQDVTRYGIDYYNKYALLNLLDELEKLDIKWIRLMYCYPELVTDELIDRVSQSNKVVKYLDIPLQHINENILKKMNRRTNTKDIYNLLDRIRKKDDNISIRSTFIAGFPSEGEEEFNELVDFIKYAQLDNCGFFEYSREEGTPAYKMSKQVPKKIKKLRVDKLYATQTDVVLNKHQSMIGQELEVMYEGIDFDRQCFEGRSYRSAPEIDSKVLFKCDNSPYIGDFVKCKIIGNDKLDLVAEVKECE